MGKTNTETIIIDQHLEAFRIAVRQYKPWHRPKWNSSNNDAFPQLINGGLKVKAFDLARGAEIFNNTEAEVQEWANGTIPDRKIRKQAWSAIKRECGLM